MADNLLGQRIPYDNPSFRYDMSGPLNMLGRGTLKEGPAPTGYDRLFDTVYNFLGGKPENRRTANILATAADYGTLGMLTGAYDGGRELAQTGRPASLAMAIMPGARVAAPAAKAVGKAATEAVQGIRAYHGSPHDFDRFDMSRIGTGEGAQAYGHGLYFAENENVARSYRDGLSQRKVNPSDGAQFNVNNPVDMAGAFMADARGNKDLAIMLARREAENRPGKKQLYDEVIKNIETGQSAKVETTGKMYEVNIKANPEDFLDWDKPLSEQSEKVRSAVDVRFANAAPIFRSSMESAQGAELYRLLSRRNSGPGANAQMRDATEFLKEQGIPGVRYLDQGSRVAGEGSRNFVIFDDSLIEILRKYGLLPPAAVGAAAASQSEPAQTVY